ncbi:MAG: hypothetical protein ACHQYQ_11430, partial [Bacteriovoracales bacterium]
SSTPPPTAPLKKENRDLQEKLRIANENIRAKDASILMLKKEIDLTKNQLNEINDFLDKEKLTNKDLSESLQKRDAEKITLQNTIAELNLNVSSYKTSLEDRESKLNQANQDINSLQVQLTSEKSESERKIASLEADLANLSGLSEEKTALQDELEKTKKESAEKIASFEKQILTLNQIKVGFEKDIETLNQNLAKSESKLSKFSDYIPFKVFFSAPNEAKINEPFDVLVEVKNKSDVVISSFKGKLELFDVNTNELIKEIEIVNGSAKTPILKSEPGILSLGIRDPMEMLDTSITKTITIQNISTPSTPPNTNGNLQVYLNQYVCPEGRVPDITFSAAQFLKQSENTTLIQGGLQPTPFGGSPSSTYVGVNLETKDIIYITKITDGEKVVGYNISLSLCRHIALFPHDIKDEWGASINAPVPIIDDRRMPTYQSIWPTTVMDTDCEMGSVDSGKVLLSIPTYTFPGTNSRVQSAQLIIEFTGASCL